MFLTLGQGGGGVKYKFPCKSLKSLLSVATFTDSQLFLTMNLAEELEDHRCLTDNKINSSDTLRHVHVDSYHPNIQACKLEETAASEHIRRLQNTKATAFQLLILTECISRLYYI